MSQVTVKPVVFPNQVWYQTLAPTAYCIPILQCHRYSQIKYVFMVCIILICF